MGSLMTTIKRFIGNKNTVTILAVLAGIVVLWYFYNYRVDQAITTVKVPYAVEAIDAGKKIETDNIKYMEITKSALKDNDIITNINDLKKNNKSKYVCKGTSIPKNGFFHESQVCEKEESPNAIFEYIPEGYTLYTLKVNSQMTYANSIMPDDYIDLYLQAKDEAGQIIFGPLIESIKVLAVRDSSGRDLFWDTSAGDTAYLLFAVPDDYHKLLNTADLISKYSIKITPVPRSASYTQEPGATQIASQQLYDFIMSNSAPITDISE